jgi:hypothetical protein
MVKTKRPALLLTASAAALLMAGGGAAYWYFSQPKAALSDLPTGAVVIPQDALMAISITTDAAQWRQLRQFGTPQSQTAFDQNLAQLRDRILTANGFNYEADIQPWVGEEVTVAFLASKAPLPPPSSAPSPLPIQQPVVVVLPIRDGLKAKQILEKPRSPQSATTSRTYKGFQIRESKSSPQNYSATVLDGKFLVMTTEPKAIDQAIDTYQGTTNLTTTPGYNQALGLIKAERPFAKVYVNLPAAAAFTAANSGRPLSNPEQVQQSQGLAATAILQPEGVQFNSVSWLKPDSQRTFEAKNTAQVMPSRLPADTILMASGGNLKRFWQDYSQGAKGAAGSPFAPIKPEILEEGLKNTVGLDWNQDFLPWMDDEFAIALASAPDGQPGLPFSVVILAKASDRRAAEATLKKLDDAMASRYQFKVEESQIAGQPVISWVMPQSNASINRGWLDGDVAFLTVGAPIANALVPKPTQSLGDSALFKAAIPSELNPNNGHFLINVDQAINAKKFPILQLPPGNRELVAAVRSIGVTAAIHDARTSRYNIFVALQKGNSPAPLPAPTVPPATPSTEPSPSPSP